MKQIKAHCAKYDKWFALPYDWVDGQEQIINLVNIAKEKSEEIETTTQGTSFCAAPNLRPCQQCGSRKVGACGHVEALGRCGAEYSYQCLFCNQLKINRSKATGRYTDWVGTNLIPDAETDQYGNARGSQYDLARDGGFQGFRIVILCLYTKEGILDGIKQPIAAMEKKGFTVTLRTEATPQALEGLLADACQLWVISDSSQHLNSQHLRVIREFYESGHGLYVFGDNAPFFADANFLSEALWHTTMNGNLLGDQVIGVQGMKGSPHGIIPAHPISTGIVNLYEGITIATVRITNLVKPLVTSSAGTVVTAIVEDGQRRALIDGGFTRLFFKWNTAGTDRFIVNAAAWLANDDGLGAAAEVSFT